MPQTYFAILTATGEAKDANAKALGVPLVITEMAVGDGNGVLPVPDRTRVALVNQVRRAPLNQLSRDPVNTNQVIAEQVIPENVGGWWIREIGLYDEDGDLIAIANCPPTYKPQLAEGSGRTQVVRMVLIVSSADSVQLKIDPAIVLATRKYADDAITASMNAHLAAADPHPQYMTSAETTQAIQSAQATEALNGSAKIATQAKTDAGADDATIVTPKKLFSSFPAKTGVRTGDASSRGMVRLTYPDGAFYSGSSSVTGAFKIAFPDGSQAYNSMVRMRVEVWDYGTDKSMTLLIAGYVTSLPNLAWSNQTVTILGQKADRDFTVRFGNDGTKPCIWIGELASDWGHPRVYIAELMASYNADGGTLSRWYSGWSIALVTAFDTVEDTITSNLVFAKSDIARVSGLQDALTDIQAAIAALALPLSALPFPTIGTANNTIAVTSASVAGQGGTVSVPAGTMLSLGEEVVAGTTGILTPFSTSAWTSANLAINSTYYLRAQVQSDVLVFYVQKGTDADSIPGSQKGTPNGASGGGFDSTVIDMLVAKVVTGAAGTAPTVTALKNKATLVAFYSGSVNSADVTFDAAMNMGGSVVMTLNWARTPTIDHISKISDGSNLSWAAGISTDVFMAKNDVVNAAGLNFDKTYVRSRYLSKIPVAVSLDGTGTNTAAWYKFEVLVRE